MSAPQLPALLQAFFTQYLRTQRDASPHTVRSYRDSFGLLLRFAAARLGRPPTELLLHDLRPELITEFLVHLEHERRNSPRTRNARLAAVHAFFRYVALRDPAATLLCRQVLAIPTKRFERAIVEFLDEEETGALLAAPDPATWIGRRDRALLLLAVQTGLRVSEVVGLQRAHVALGTGAHVRCLGKGRKMRCTPLRSDVTRVVRQWLEELPAADDTPLFPSSRGGHLSCDAVERLVAKHARVAAKSSASIAAKRVTPHVLRHSAAMALLRRGVDEASLDAMAPDMTWWMEKPSSTPMQEACVAAGLNRRQVLSELSRSDPDRARGWNEKTIDNLWNGGPAHPSLDSIEMVAELLLPADAAALARWRRWYGLRHLARQFAGLWGWDWLNGNLATTLAHARIFAHDLRRSSLRSDQQRTVASVVLWSGWRSYIARFAFGSTARLEGDEPHPTLRLDYQAIGSGEERLRLDDCVASVKGAGSFEGELQRRGRSPEAARAEALHLIWMTQGDMKQFADPDPIAQLLAARQRQDWRAAEKAARALVQMRPEYVDNHYVLVEALAHEGRFEDALSVIRDAEARFPSAPCVARGEILTLMLRGDHNRLPTDFEAARDKLLACAPADTEWEAHLLLADCHLALGDWEAALQSSNLVATHNLQCGEARAIASICCAKLGKRQPENKAAEHAVRRGEQALLEELQRRDAAGELGSASLLPFPRWHRLSVQPEATVHL